MRLHARFFEVGQTNFDEPFHNLTILASLQLFRLYHINVIGIGVTSLAWPASQTATSINHYAVIPLLVKYVIRRRLATTNRPTWKVICKAYVSSQRIISVMNNVFRCKPSNFAPFEHTGSLFHLIAHLNASTVYTETQALKITPWNLSTEQLFTLHVPVVHKYFSVLPIMGIDEIIHLNFRRSNHLTGCFFTIMGLNWVSVTTGFCIAIET